MRRAGRAFLQRGLFDFGWRHHSRTLTATPTRSCLELIITTKLTSLARTIRTHLIHSVVVIVTVATCTGQDVSRIDQVLTSYVSRGMFMGSVLIARGDELVFSKGYGSANLEWRIPNSPSTKFRIGSLTKQFTAAAVLLLEERGKVRIEDPVKVYLPEAPAAWDKVTVFSLLTHTSGIADYTRFSSIQSLKVFPATADEIVTWFRDKPLEFPPGEQFSYSNSGYALLGYLIERISGRSYEQFVEENIFMPLGMKDSGYDSNSIITNRAAGYSPGVCTISRTPPCPGPVNAAFIDMSVAYAAGALYSTTLDLWRWEQALFGGKLLSARSVLKMTTPYKSNYGFGLLVDTASARRVIRHNGGIEGFNTYLAYYPDDKMTIVVLGNLNGRAPDEIGPILGRLAHGEAVCCY